jgi:hypothetical protein
LTVMGGATVHAARAFSGWPTRHAKRRAFRPALI